MTVLLAVLSTEGWAGRLSGSVGPIGRPDLRLLPGFIGWVAVPVVLAWAIRNAIETLRGGLLHERLRRYRFGLAAPAWVRCLAGVLGAGALWLGWYAWLEFGFALCTFGWAIHGGWISGQAAQYVWYVSRMAWIGVVLSGAWMGLWLGRGGYAATGIVGLCSAAFWWSGGHEPWLAGYSVGGDALAAALCLAAVPLAVWLAVALRRRWPAQPTPVPPPDYGLVTPHSPQAGF